MNSRHCLTNSSSEAVYEDQVFKPIGVVSLPDGTRVVASLSDEPKDSDNQDSVDHRVMSILSRRHNSGQTDVAARHNEHFRSAGFKTLF